MNVLFINTMTDTFTPSNSYSTATWVWELCRAAREDGVESSVISSGSPYEPFNWKKLFLIPPPVTPKGWLATKWNNQFRHYSGWVHPGQRGWCTRVISAIEANRLQSTPMILSNDIELAVTLRKRFPSACIIHVAHGHNGARENFRAKFASAVNLACGVSDFTRKWNQNYFGLPPEKTRALPNGVDLTAYYPSEPKPKRPLISFHSRIDPDKGPDILLRAALRLSERTTKFDVQLIGRPILFNAPPRDFDRQLQSLESSLIQRGVNVTRMGWLSRQQMPGALQKASIHVTPSRWDEPFGLTTLEGMACGLATIGSNTGGTAEVIGDAGLLFERDNEEQLASHLERLVCNPSLIAEYGRRARLRAEQFSWASTWRQLRQMITASVNAASTTTQIGASPSQPRAVST